MSTISWSKDETVAMVSMNDGENRHNRDFAVAMNRVLDEIVADPSTQAIVLTSSDPKNFSLGVDVDWLYPLRRMNDLQPIREFMYGMSEVFKKLMLVPMPTIAAINGHAFGNGAILACACDFRFMRSDRGFFCFPEVDIGIPLMYGQNAFVKKAIPQHELTEMQFTGGRYAAPELERRHVIKKACANQEELMKESLAFAKTFRKRRGIMGEMKKRMYWSIIETMETMDPKHSIEPVFIVIPD